MNRRLATSILAVVLAAPLALSAHDESKHKGDAMMGEITAISEGEISLKTHDGVKTVVLNQETAILDGEAKIESSALKAGDHVTVHGTTQADGGIVAKKVMKGMTSSEGMKMGGMKKHGHKKMGHKKMGHKQ